MEACEAVKLRSLEAFCAAVEERTISGAARRMYLSQPSVSDRLSELEQEAHAPLLQRSRHGVEPTEQGALLYEHARRVLEEIRSLERLLRTLGDQRDARLRIAASSTLGEHLLPEWLRDFYRLLPGSAPTLFVGNTREVLEMVCSGKAAFGVVEGPQTADSLQSTPLLADELVVVVSAGHPWSRRRIGAEDLQEGPFISREPGSGTREVIERRLAELGVTLNIRMEIGSTSAIKEAIKAGLGFSILSRETIRLELLAGTLAVAEGFVVPRHLDLVHDPEAEMSPAEQEFYEYLLNMPRRSDAGGRMELED